MSSKKQPPQNLAAMQDAAETAAKRFRAAIAALARAQLEHERAEEAHARARKAFQSAVEQVKATTKVGG